jgi:hypothetical protein
VSFATVGREIVLARGGTSYSYDGTDLQPIDFPDGQDVLAVEFFGDRFIYVPANPTVGRGAITGAISTATTSRTGARSTERISPMLKPRRTGCWIAR